MGGSAGGLLMGAIVNLEPTLFKGIIAAVPFVDVVTTMLDDSIPLTTLEYNEWGNPNNKDYYSYIKSYSPYDNISEKKYPYILATAGYHDSQVQYWEPAKWVAKLRDFNNSENPILLHTNMDAGHGGASGRFKILKEVAMEYAFLIGIELFDRLLIPYYLHFMKRNNISYAGLNQISSRLFHFKHFCSVFRKNNIGVYAWTDVTYDQIIQALNYGCFAVVVNDPKETKSLLRNI